MKKNNKKIRNIFFIIILLMLPLGVFAVAAAYTSTLYISPGALHTGSVRDYLYSNHKIAIRADAFPDPSNTNRKLVIEIGTKGIFGDFNSKSRKVANLSLGATTTTTMGNIGSGKKLYRFGAHSNAGNSSGGVGTYYAGVDSKYVRMTSY